MIRRHPRSTPFPSTTLFRSLSKATPLKVTEARDGVALEVNRVYIIPPDADMAVKGGRLVLTPRPARNRAHMPIDHLFRSLAEDRKSNRLDSSHSQISYAVF